MRTGPAISSRKFWEPKVDLLESHEGFVLKAEIAGVRADDIELIYNEERHSILIRGVRSEEDLPAGHQARCHQLEVFYGDFEREISLPDQEVEPAKMKASYRNGFLLVTIPKL